MPSPPPSPGACELGGEDAHGFVLCFIVTVAMQLSFFAVAFLCKFDKVTDFAGGMNFVLLALLTLFADGREYTTRQLIATLLVVASRLELSLLLLYRVLKRGHDARFDEMRERCCAFLGFWIFQIMWVYVVSAPIIYLNCESAANNPAIGAMDYVGWALAGGGTLLQLVADLQKMSFRNDPANRGRVCDVGLWRFSRHPNYFAEMLIWWGIFACALPIFRTEAGTRMGVATIASPLFTMLILLFLSGMPTAEGAGLARFFRTADSRERFLAYFARTPPIIPFVPACYAVMPQAAKRALCCEFDMYAYREDSEVELRPSTLSSGCCDTSDGASGGASKDTKASSESSDKRGSGSNSASLLHAEVNSSAAAPPVSEQPAAQSST